MADAWSALFRSFGELPEHVEIHHLGRERREIGVEALEPGGIVEAESLPDRLMEPRVEFLLECAVIRVEAAAPADGAQPELGAPGAVLFFDEEHAPPDRHEEPAAHGDPQREGHGLRQREVALAEILLAADEARALRGEDVLDEDLDGRKLAREQPAGSFGEGLRRRRCRPVGRYLRCPI